MVTSRAGNIPKCAVAGGKAPVRARSEACAGAAVRDLHNTCVPEELHLQTSQAARGDFPPSAKSRGARRRSTAPALPELPRFFSCESDHTRLSSATVQPMVPVCTNILISAVLARAPLELAHCLHATARPACPRSRFVGPLAPATNPTHSFSFPFPHVDSLSLELLRRRSGPIEVVMSRRQSASYSSARLSNASDSSEGEAARRNNPKPQNQLYSTGHHTPEIELQDIPPSRTYWHQGPDSDQAPQEVASSGVSGRSENGGHTRRRSRARSAASPPPPPEPEYPTVDHLPWYAHKYEFVRIPQTETGTLATCIVLTDFSAYAQVCLLIVMGVSQLMCALAPWTTLTHMFP